MYQYTTPTLPLHFKDLDFSEVACFRIALKGQRKYFLKIVDSDDPNVDAVAKKVYVPLSQTETAELGMGSMLAQTRIVYTDGNVDATNKVRIAIDDVLDEVVVDV